MYFSLFSSSSSLALANMSAGSVTDKIETIKARCQAEGFFYNAVPETQAVMVARPPNVTPLQWEEALAKKPTAYASVPVKWEGFQEVFTRVELQKQHVATCNNLLTQIDTKLDTLMNNHTLNTKLAKCQLRQRTLDTKLLKVAINLSILKSKGYPISPQEEQLIQAFNTLTDKLNNPMGVMRITELWAKLNRIRESQVVPVNNEYPKDAPSNESIREIVKILAKQQQGIQTLSDMVQKDLDVVDKQLQHQQQQQKSRSGQ